MKPKYLYTIVQGKVSYATYSPPRSNAVLDISAVVEQEILPALQEMDGKLPILDIKVCFRSVVTSFKIFLLNTHSFLFGLISLEASIRRTEFDFYFLKQIYQLLLHSLFLYITICLSDERLFKLLYYFKISNMFN